MAFRLKLRATELDLPQGELMIGRGTDCFLRIDDDLVSRRHAKLVVGPSQVRFEDLGSRNGSRVNGNPVHGSIDLEIGDEVEIGAQTFRLLETTTRDRAPTATMPPVRACATCGTVMEARLRACPKCGVSQGGDDPDPSRSVSSFELLLGVGDKMLALGRIDEAEKMLGPRLREIGDRAARGGAVPRDEVGHALLRAVKLAAATKSSDWYSWIFDFARHTRHRLDEMLLDELHAHMLAHKPSAAVALQALIDAQAGKDPLAMQQRRRLEGLLRFCRG